MAKAKSKKGAAKPIPGLRVVLSNDDGVNAPGMKVLERVAKTISDDVWVVAPASEQSGASHSLSLHDPLRLHQLSKRRFAVQGTPTDSVIMAVNHIFKDTKKPDLLLSGVNRGANLGEDLPYSGTVAAAMEGCIAGIPSIALSQAYLRPHPIKWATAEKHAPELVRKIVTEGFPKDVMININFPDVVAESVKGVRVCPHGKRNLRDLQMDERIDARGMPYYWIGVRPLHGEPDPKTDLGVVRDGGISVTPLRLNFTHQATRRNLAKILE